MKRIPILILFCGAAGIAHARTAQGGLGVYLVAAVVIAIAWVATLVLFGGPMALINKAFGKDASDDFGGKVFAISFVVSPVFFVVGLELAELVGGLIGWAVGIFVTAKFIVKN